jgi:hypothetical protein
METKEKKTTKKAKRPATDGIDVSKEIKPKLTQRQINREIMKLSKEVNRNITLRTLKAWLAE